jgi:hypothetical protein
MRTTTTIILSLIAISLIVATAPTGAEEPAPAEALPSLDHILDRYIEAVGGRDALEKLTTRTCKVTAIHDLSWTDPQRQEIPIEVYVKTPDKWLIIEHKPAGERREWCDGEKVWLQEAEGAALEHSNRNRKLLYLYDPRNALRVRDHFPELTVKGEKTLKDRPVYVVEPTKLDPLHYALYFDAESGLLAGIGTYWKLQDYREVDGVLLPHKIDCSRKGGSSTFIFNEVKHNQPLEESLFTSPAQETLE